MSVDEVAYVYLMGLENGPYKVGIALDPQRRKGEVQTGSPFPLTLFHQEPVNRRLSKVAEGKAHRLLASHRMQGEWFGCDVETAISGIKEGVRFASQEGFSEEVLRAESVGALAMLLRDRRTDLRLSLRQAAQAAGMTKAHLWDLETGRANNPTARTIYGLERALKVNAGDLLESLRPLADRNTGEKT